MKTSACLLILCCLFVACKKDRKETSIEGHWEWVQSNGGLAGINETPQSTGKNWQVVFNNDLSCSQSGTYRQPASGVYTLTQETTNSVTTNFVNSSMIEFMGRYAYSFEGNRLKLYEDGPDGLNYFFERGN